jgi:hypothetical protein
MLNYLFEYFKLSKIEKNFKQKAYPTGSLRDITWQRRLSKASTHGSRPAAPLSVYRA